jgi:hypothetical protein
MKPPKDIDTPLTKKCNTWEELKKQGVSVDKVLYLPIGVTTGNIKIQKTKSYETDKINRGIKEREFINIENLKQNELNNFISEDSNSEREE